MHRCLLTVEFVDRIARNVDSGCLDMALACKTFYEPAMNALWRKMDGIEPLVRCLPVHVLTNGGDTESDLNIITKPEENDWTRVLHYSVRIRELQLAWLDIEDEHFAGLDFAVYGALGDFIPCSRLLPNLERLICHDNMGSNAPYFIQPSLRFFMIYDLREDADKIAAKFQEPGCGAIQELQVLDDEMDFEDEESFEDIHSMIMALDQLTSLTLMGPLSDDTLKHLASLPNLVSLSFHFSNIDYARILPWAFPNPFQALRKLKVLVNDHEDSIVPFLSAISPLSLIDLHVEYGHMSVPEEAGKPHMDEGYLHSVFSTIAHKLSLEHISLTAADGRAEATGLVTVTVLEPLRALQSLRSLRLTGFQLQLSSSDVEKLVWPNVETLHLCPKSSVSGGLTPKDITVLKQKCPLLSEVAVRLNRTRDRP